MAVVHSWGYKVNGSWTGMTGYLQRGNADVGATALYITESRLSVLTYIAGTTLTRWVALPVAEDVLRNQYSVTWWRHVPPLIQLEMLYRIYRLRPVTNAYPEPNYFNIHFNVVLQFVPVHLNSLLPRDIWLKFSSNFSFFTPVFYAPISHSHFVWLT
jgi:hypothetical protein